MNRKTIHITPSPRLFDRNQLRWLLALLGLFIALLTIAVAVAMLLDPLISKV